MYPLKIYEKDCRLYTTNNFRFIHIIFLNRHNKVPYNIKAKIYDESNRSVKHSYILLCDIKQTMKTELKNKLRGIK